MGEIDRSEGRSPARRYIVQQSDLPSTSTQEGRWSLSPAVQQPMIGYLGPRGCKTEVAKNNNTNSVCKMHQTHACAGPAGGGIKSEARPLQSSAKPIWVSNHRVYRVNEDDLFRGYLVLFGVCICTAGCLSFCCVGRCWQGRAGQGSSTTVPAADSPCVSRSRQAAAERSCTDIVCMVEVQCSGI